MFTVDEEMFNDVYNRPINEEITLHEALNELTGTEEITWTDLMQLINHNKEVQNEQ